MAKNNPIVKTCARLLEIPSRLEKVVGWYLLSLTIDSQKHTQTSASELSGLHKSQFSRLLSKNSGQAVQSLRLASQKAARRLSKQRGPLFPSCPWNVAIVIDATLHRRSSRHVQNAQYLNHGEGFVLGHQWTNLVLVVGEQSIPLPPIVFYSRKECQRRGILYRTEHEKVIETLAELDLRPWLGDHDPTEIVVLMDSGYDNKKIQNTILSRGWDLLGSIKSIRSVQSQGNRANGVKSWKKVAELFRTTKKYCPWRTVRLKKAAGGRKRRREFRMRQIEGYLRGVDHLMILVCSKTPKNKGQRYFVCSRLTLTPRVLIQTYRIRWKIELFHRAVKSNLGLMDAGVSEFDSLVSHVHWVYVAYIILALEPTVSQPTDIRKRQTEIRKRIEVAKLKHVIQLSTRAHGGQKVFEYCQMALAELQVA